MFRVRLAQGDVEAFFDLSQLPLREGMRSEPANEPIKLSVRDIASQLR
jgi:hypothetical protein